MSVLTVGRKLLLVQAKAKSCISSSGFARGQY